LRPEAVDEARHPRVGVTRIRGSGALGKVSKMKKLLALICACVFAGSLASAQWNVYDFKASIKRLDSQIKKIKYSPGYPDETKDTITEELNTFNNVSDTLTGFLLIQTCSDCSGSASSSTAFPYSWLYLKRGGDKTLAVWRFSPEVNQGLYNTGVAIDQDSYAGGPTSYKKLKNAWMTTNWSFNQEIEHWVPEGSDYVTAPADPLFAYYSSTVGWQPYGFLGFSSVAGDFSMTGFGSALGTVDPIFCSSGDNTCFVVTSITGGIIGWDWKDGICGLGPTWDLCSLTPVGTNPDSTTHVNGVSYGAWSVKLNTKLSAQIRDFPGGVVDPEGNPTHAFDLAAVQMLIKKATNTNNLFINVPTM